MARVRLYLYNSHDGGGSYVYDTGVLDTGAPAGQGCLNPDAQQFASIQDLLAYSAARGESVQQVFSVNEVNSLCSGSVAAPPTVPGGIQSCPGGICGPQQPTGITSTGAPGPIQTAPVTTNVVPTGPGTGTFVSPTTPATYGGSPSPFSGQLSGTGPGAGPTPRPAPSSPAGQTVTTGGAPATGFDLGEFIRGPMGVLSLIIVVGLLLLTRKGG